MLDGTTKQRHTFSPPNQTCVLSAIHPFTNIHRPPFHSLPASRSPAPSRPLHDWPPPAESPPPRQPTPAAAAAVPRPLVVLVAAVVVGTGACCCCRCRLLYAYENDSNQTEGKSGETWRVDRRDDTAAAYNPLPSRPQPHTPHTLEQMMTQQTAASTVHRLPFEPCTEPPTAAAAAPAGTVGVCNAPCRYPST